jgi:hypothetical protein
MKNVCDFCYRSFPLNPNARNQKYCTRPDCRRERRRIWQKNRRSTDKDYKENQARVYKDWTEKHPDYWKNYRSENPDYVRKNREKQTQRNKKQTTLKELPDFVKAEIAKMEGSNRKIYLKSGYYILIPFRNKEIAKVEKLVVKIDIFSKI